jgi:FKBP-type peptidyl-prolyl cis-trans isomerase SlyD
MGNHGRKAPVPGWLVTSAAAAHPGRGGFFSASSDPSHGSVGVIGFDRMKIARDTVVTLDYKLTNDQGELLDQSEGEPLTYLHGHGQLVPGLELALEGQGAGAKLTVKVEPKEGYGVRIGSKSLEIPRTEFPEGEPIESGMSIEAVGNDGKTVTLWIVDQNEENVIVSLDHPLAGVTLHFEVDVKDVRKATKEELAHGHVHGPGDHHHP